MTKRIIACERKSDFLQYSAGGIWGVNGKLGRGKVKNPFGRKKRGQGVREGHGWICKRNRIGEAKSGPSMMIGRIQKWSGLARKKG